MKKFDIIESFDEILIISSIINKEPIQYVLYSLLTSEYVIKSEEEVKANFSQVSVKDLSLQSYTHLMLFLTNEYKELSTHFFNNKKFCFHVIENKFDSAFCNICELDFGHFCQDSPDNTCHYFTEKEGFILLNNGNKILPPLEHNQKYETYDCCIFCGEPEERK